MMRAYTEAERAALIEHLEMCLTDETFFDSVVDFNARQREANLIALAALTAEPEIEVEDGDVLSAIFPVGTSFYTTPPIAAPAAPDGFVMVPRALTAENGAKAALLGEFNLEYNLVCHECFGEGCDDCSGDGRWTKSIPVDWTTIKEIWAKGIEHFEAAAPEVE